MILSGEEKKAIPVHLIWISYGAILRRNSMAFSNVKAVVVMDRAGVTDRAAAAPGESC